MTYAIADSHVVTGLVLNVPEWFRQEDFLEWLNDDRTPRMTWHDIGRLPNEFSDTMVLVDGGLSGEGSEEGIMPAWAWDAIVEACRGNALGQDAHIPVRLTNLGD